MELNKEEIMYVLECVRVLNNVKATAEYTSTQTAANGEIIAAVNEKLLNLIKLIPNA